VIEGIEQYTNAKLKVFDRWGKEVYSNEHYSNGWSPTDLSSGTYYYIVTLPYGTVKEKAGYFTILTTE
jgi:gliding motility-associated-like protein